MSITPSPLPNGTACTTVRDTPLGHFPILRIFSWPTQQGLDIQRDASFAAYRFAWHWQEEVVLGAALAPAPAPVLLFFLRLSFLLVLSSILLLSSRLPRLSDGGSHHLILAESRLYELIRVAVVALVLNPSLGPLDAIVEHPERVQLASPGLGALLEEFAHLGVVASGRFLPASPPAPPPPSSSYSSSLLLLLILLLWYERAAGGSGPGSSRHVARDCGYHLRVACLWVGGTACHRTCGVWRATCMCLSAACLCMPVPACPLRRRLARLNEASIWHNISSLFLMLDAPCSLRLA